ncbi:translation initiation factor eIF-3, subunit D [Cantharellus anzutake]|uniref:translation initiation factor eIF-3, subunit D n=1 Tax=Cantharellus anzutake TaxID=1750568 RepID=UPI001905723A|nr:translation initiation factor eIF-3, subunit D [Cantharellus anzutake]KAF8341451.1 translation initiation factor eIF-3, subunit D [Cantharellus anzutake]
MGEPFSLPPILDSDTWGPPASSIADQFKGIPYAPYSKSDKLGRFADWSEIDARGTAVSGTGVGAQAASRPIGAGTLGAQRFPGGRREGQPTYGAGTANSFGYYHVEDESSFSVVDHKGAPTRRGAPPARGRGAVRGNSRGRPGTGRTGYQAGRGSARTGFRRGGWRDWDKPSRIRESSVPISPSWQQLEEIEFTRLNKLHLDVSDPDTLDSHGRLFAYDKSYDRITTKSEKPLQIMDRIRYNPTTSDDLVIQQLAVANTATIFATDNILSLLMCAPRSVYPWDIIIVHENGKLFFDKREGGPFDYITVNENASDPPLETDKDNINSPGSLSLEATYVDHNFSFQVVREDQPLNLPKPNPFYGPEETEPLASCAYRYRLFDLSISEEESFKLLARTQVDAYIPGSTPSKAQYVTLKTLNEFDSRAQGAGGAPDWRIKLDSQRGAVVSTEMKNNSCKLGKWAVQAVLAGADVTKIGYVSRVNPRENTRHVILSTSTVRPSDFASQLNVSLPNGWGIVRTIADLVLRQPEGKYLLVKDPNKPVIRLYSIPASAFTGEDDEVLDKGGDDGNAGHP